MDRSIWRLAFGWAGMMQNLKSLAGAVAWPWPAGRSSAAGSGAISAGEPYSTSNHSSKMDGGT